MHLRALLLISAALPPLLAATASAAADLHPPAAEEALADGCLLRPGCRAGGDAEGGGGEEEDEEEAEEADWLQFSLLQTSLQITRERGHPKPASGRAAAPPAAAVQRFVVTASAEAGGDEGVLAAGASEAEEARAASEAAADDSAVAAAPGASAGEAAAAAPAGQERGGGREEAAEGSAQMAGGLLRAEAWLAGHVRAGGVAALHWLGSLAAGNRTSSVALSSTASRILNLAFDPGRGMVDGVPILLICSLAFVIGLVFMIQVLGWSLEGKDMIDDLGKGGVPRSRLSPAGGTAAYYRQDGRAGSSPFVGGASAYQQTLGPPSSGYLPMPPTADMGSFGSASRLGASAAAAGGGPPRSSDSVPRQSGGVADSQASVDRSNALCPALILPHREAQFSVAAESIRELGLGQFPAQILGPSGRPLLHAHLPTQPVGGALASLGSGRWLELTTTATSRHPHACIGPLPLGAPSRQPLEIRGPRGDAYGTLEPQASGWVALKGGLTVLRLEFGSQGALHAYSEDAGMVPGIIATAALDGSYQALRVQVNPGVDALLTVLCMLAVVLMTPDLAGLRA